MVANEIFPRSGRYRERQYQLAAQRHNEALLKLHYRQQTARYFARECEIARHYDSWNVKTAASDKYLQQLRKDEELSARRNKLRKLLKEEEEAYREELQQLRRRPSNGIALPSLEALRDRLKQKQAEQNLYYPRSCRRYYSNVVCAKQPAAGSFWRFANGGDPQQRYQPPNSTSYHPVDGMSTTTATAAAANGGSSEEDQRNVDATRTTDRERARTTNAKYSARYSRRSLENTNVRSDDGLVSTPRSARNELDLTNERSDDGSCAYKLTQADDAADSPLRHGSLSDEKAESGLTSSPSAQRDDRSIVHGAKLAIARDKLELARNDPRPKALSNDNGTSREALLYLTHEELKRKIEDLGRREQHACNKQSWNEALRLRDMKNRLDFSRESKLYRAERDDAQLDENAWKLGVENMQRRTAELAERKHVCTDSTLYSEEAKTLWKKWVHEDDLFATNGRLQRESLMDKLEAVWLNLSIQDKERISRSYESGSFSSGDTSTSAAAANYAK